MGDIPNVSAISFNTEKDQAVKLHESDFTIASRCFKSSHSSCLSYSVPSTQ